MKYRIIILLAIAILIYGCSESKYDERLLRISEIVSASPAEALSGLDSICCDSLSEEDRHYYDFLTVKATDKAFGNHRSDSLILSVISYYSQHPDGALYPEALYYGGRVYSDLGDKPRALSYFHSALDTLPDKKENLNLRFRILSQTGRLQDALRLHESAIKSLTEALEIERELNDSVSEVYDLQLLGGIFLRNKNYDMAEKCFREAICKSRNMDVSFKAVSSMYIAGLKHKTGQVDSALIYIRNTPDLVDDISRNTALAYASNIYKAAGIADTAYMYSHKLINSNYNHNKKTGYQNILSPKLKQFVKLDSLYQYIEEYIILLEKEQDNNQNELAVMQQALYNYEFQERDKNKFKNAYNNVLGCIWVLLGIIVALIIWNLCIRNKRQANIIEMQQAREEINNRGIPNSVDIGLTRSPIENNYKGWHILLNHLASAIFDKPSEDSIRIKFRKDLLSLYEKTEKLPDVPDKILQSEVYEKLQKKILASQSIKDREGIWSELEKVVLESFPRFVKYLNLLTAGRQTTIDLHTALLIKCGFKPSQMMILFGVTNGTINSRRESLCIRALGEKMSVKVIDGVIRLL